MRPVIARSSQAGPLWQPPCGCDVGLADDAAAEVRDGGDDRRTRQGSVERRAGEREAIGIGRARRLPDAVAAERGVPIAAVAGIVADVEDVGRQIAAGQIAELRVLAAAGRLADEQGAPRNASKTPIEDAAIQTPGSPHRPRRGFT